MNTNPEILMIGDMSPGGMSSVVNQYLDNGLADKVIFLPSYKGGSLVENISFYGKFLIKYINTLITNKDIKIIHIHTSHRGSFFRKAIITYIGKIFKKKTIFHIHGSEFNKFYDTSPKLIKYLINDVLNKSDLILALSSQRQKDIEQKCSNKNIRVLYNPAKINSINAIRSQTVNVLFMGRLGYRKGAYDIIEAAKYLNNPNIRINLYGDGEVEEIRELVNRNNLNKTVYVGGWINGKQSEEAFKEADICILPSYNEGLPMFILEAMGYGLPVISTPVGGIPDSIKDGINGYLITPGDFKTLSQKIQTLALNPELRQKMGYENQKLIREKFEIGAIIDKLNEMYKELISHP